MYLSHWRFRRPFSAVFLDPRKSAPLPNGMDRSIRFFRSSLACRRPVDRHTDRPRYVTTSVAVARRTYAMHAMRTDVCVQYTCTHAATSSEYGPPLPVAGHIMRRLGIDVCDTATSESDGDPADQDHTPCSSPVVNAGGRRHSPAGVCRPASGSNDEQQGPRT